MSAKREDVRSKASQKTPPQPPAPWLPTGPNQPTIKDAVIVGDLFSDVAQAVLDSELIAGFSTHAPRVPKDKWIQRKLSWSDHLQELTQHPVEAEKEGTALFFNETQLTGESKIIGGKEEIFIYRGKAYVESVTAYVIDIDGTDHIDRVRDRLVELDLFAILYTTYSHSTKATADGDYFRVIIPLDQPFRVEDNGGDVNIAAKEWLSRYMGFSTKLGIKELDPSAAKFVQLMYLPRRPSENSEFKHYVVAGRALKIDEMPKAVTSDQRKSTALRISGQQGEQHDFNGCAVLKDSFDVYAWFTDYGVDFEIELFLSRIGWDIRNEQAGDGMTIMCANHREHSKKEDGSDQATWCCPSNDEKQFVLTCQHAHCVDINTWDFIKLIEDRLDDGDAVLPDGIDSLSELLCSPELYKHSDGKTGFPVASKYRAKSELNVQLLSTPKQVEDAFQSLKQNANCGDAEFIELFAGVELAGNKHLAVDRLHQLLKTDGHYNTNEIANLKKQGALLVKEVRARNARQSEVDLRQKLEAAIDKGAELAHPSMDIADPIGDTMEEAIATLNNRWKPISIGGRFKVLRVPDPEKLNNDSVVIEAMSKPDFVMYHKDRLVSDGKTLVNPADTFLSIAQRASSIEFTPPPVEVSVNAYNLYRGRKIDAVEGSCERLKLFIKHTVCRGREDIFWFVWLYLAHLVQRPGEKAMTAIVLRGLGGCGKSTFGTILERLAAPHSLTISQEEHVTGRFAGQHLATSLVAICTEALFAGDPKVNGKLKNLVTAPTIMVEPKGLPVIQMNSYTRFFFDSNHDRVVPIDANGSERRYLVLEINDDHKNDKAYFDELYAEMDGAGIQALAWELVNYDPSADSLSWDDLRAAPDTPERHQMRWHSMRPIERSLVQMFEDGEVELKTQSGQVFKYTFKPGEPIRLPQSELRQYLRPSMNQYEAKDGDIKILMEDLFGQSILDHDGKERITVKKSRGNIQCGKLDREGDCDEDETVRIAIRYLEFPPIEMLKKVIAKRYNREGFDDQDEIIEA